MKNFIEHHFALVLGGLCMVCGAQLYAEELSDPTRPPTSIFAPADAAGNAKNSAAGLQSIIISKQRRAAIIDGVTVELGGKHGDSRLIEINEGNVVLSGTHGRRVLTLFPDVKVFKKSDTTVGK